MHKNNRHDQKISWLLLISLLNLFIYSTRLAGVQKTCFPGFSLASKYLFQSRIRQCEKTEQIIRLFFVEVK